MSQSLAKIYVHSIFSTKGRNAWLVENIRSDLYAYMATVLKNMNCPVIQIGGTTDHVHVLNVLSKNMSMAQLIEGIKKPTSKWLKTKGMAYGKFHWQNGYGAFSVSQSHVDKVKQYIANQEEHHRQVSFEDEFRSFLDKYQMPYDEKYVWD